MGAQIEGKCFRHARVILIDLDAQNVGPGDKAGRLGIAMQVSVSTHGQTRQSGNGLRNWPLQLANERHPVALTRLRCAGLRANLDQACGWQVEIGDRSCRAWRRM